MNLEEAKRGGRENCSFTWYERNEAFELLREELEKLEERNSIFAEEIAFFISENLAVRRQLRKMELQAEEATNLGEEVVSREIYEKCCNQRLQMQIEKKSLQNEAEVLRGQISSHGAELFKLWKTFTPFNESGKS